MMNPNGNRIAVWVNIPDGRTEFLDPPDADRPDTVDNMFREVRLLGNTLPDNLGSQFTELSSRCSELEQNLDHSGSLATAPGVSPRGGRNGEAVQTPGDEKWRGRVQAAPAPDVAVELDVLDFCSKSYN